MSHETMAATIRCDDNAEMLVFDRTIWARDDELLEFSIMDSYIGTSKYHGLLGRFRRAWHAFLAKPIYYAEIVVTERERAINFLNECLAILDSDAEGQMNEENHTTEQTE